MTIEIKRNAEETVIELAGRLDTTTAPALDKTISNDIESTKNRFLISRAWNISPAQVFAFFSARRRRCRRSVL